MREGERSRPSRRTAAVTMRQLEAAMVVAPTGSVVSGRPDRRAFRSAGTESAAGMVRSLAGRPPAAPLYVTKFFA